MIKNSRDSLLNDQRVLATIEKSEIYRFDDPVTAYQILEKLDIFEQIPVDEHELNTMFARPYLGLIPDTDYCKKHRAWMVIHPEVIFTQQNIITSFTHDSLFRQKVIPEVGNDAQPYIDIWKKMEFRNSFLYDLRVDVNNFFTFYQTYDIRALGSQFSCLSQSSNAIPGHESLLRKDYISEGLVAYVEAFKSKPHCVNSTKFFPETYILYKKQACRDFFQMLRSQAYQDLKKERGGIVFLRKIGVNPQIGVFLVNEKEEAKISAYYRDGELCGEFKANNIIQYHIYNPLLLDGHKFEVRVYMLIASSNPVIAYYYDGFLGLYLDKENRTTFPKPLDKEKSMGVTEAEIEDFQFLWSFQQLENYLYDNKIITDRDWLDNYLRPEIKRALVHLVRVSQASFKKLSSAYHLFSLDFMLDVNLNLWYMKANPKPTFPDLERFPAEMETHIIKMLKDHYEIIYGLLRSRMKRIIQYINQMSSAEILANDLMEFQRISRNYFEDEFLPSPGNKFQAFVDDNYNDERRYFGLLKKECFLNETL